MEKNRLPESFSDNLDFIAEGLHGRPINVNYAAEWKITAANATLLLEYLYKTGIVEITWLPEKQQMCFVKKDEVTNKTLMLSDL